MSGYSPQQNFKGIFAHLNFPPHVHREYPKALRLSYEEDGKKKIREVVAESAAHELQLVTEHADSQTKRPEELTLAEERAADLALAASKAQSEVAELHKLVAELQAKLSAPKAESFLDAPADAKLSKK